MSAKRPQAFASVRKRPRVSESVGECRRVSESVANRRESQIVAKRRTVVTLYASRLKSVNSHRDRGVLVAKRRTVVTFGLVSSLRISKMSTVTGIGGVLVERRDRRGEER